MSEAAEVTQVLHAIGCMLGEQTVDLQPLFEWSSNPDASERPLSAWKRVRGRIVQETPYGWLLEGEAEGRHDLPDFW